MKPKSKTIQPTPDPIPTHVQTPESPPNNFWGWVFISFFVVGIPILGILINIFREKPPH